jgi:hypothetical protein
LFITTKSLWPHLGPRGLASHLGGFGKRDILAMPGSAPGRPPTTVEDVDDPSFEHRFASQHWDSGFWQTFVDSHSPVKGTYRPHHPPSFSFPLRHSYGWGEEEHCGPSSSSLNHMPKLNFPSFDGSSSKLWQSKCEKYLDMYNTKPHVWVKVSTMHFEGVATRWLQSVEPRLSFF